MKTDSKEFKKLQDKWYKKAKKSGFDDIESSEDNLKFWSGPHFLRKTDNYVIKKEYFESVESYYRLAGNFLWEHEFKTKQERKIWDLHSQGTSIRDISVVLYKTDSKRDKINKILMSLTQIMLKKYKINE